MCGKLLATMIGCGGRDWRVYSKVTQGEVVECVVQVMLYLTQDMMTTDG